MDVPSSPTIEYQVLVVAAGLTFLAGFLINVFIVAVNICDWKKGRPVSTADKVITSLGVSRMVFQGVCLLEVISDTYFPGLRILNTVCVCFLEMTSVYSSIWLSTLLSVIFSFKISTLHNAFFLWLKNLVLNQVFLLIIISMVVSGSHALATCLIINLNNSYNSTHETYDKVLFGLDMLVLVFLSIGPFLIYFISSLLLIIYLYHHMSRMKSERNGTSHLDTYYKTIKFTGFSLFCSTSYIIVEQTADYIFDAFGFLGVYFSFQIFPIIHSMFLIYMISKLRSQVSNMVLLLKSICCDPKALEETVSQ